MVLECYCPERNADLAKWYVDHVQNLYMKLISQPPFTVKLCAKDDPGAEE